MAWRKVLAAALVVVAASPAWGATEALGNITTSSAAAVRDTKLSEGSTVFSGDVINVAENGGTRMSLHGGAQVEVLGGSSVQFTKEGEKIQMRVDRGQADFRSSGNSGISALEFDATVRPAGGGETSAIIQSLSEGHAVVAAEKGALLITTAHDGKTYTVSEGEAADLSAAGPSAAPGSPQSGPPPAGKSAPSLIVPSKTIVICTVVILAAGATAAAIYLARHENKLSTTQLQNEISPAKLN